MVEELNRPHLKLTLAFCIHENCIVQFANCLPDSYREPTAYFFFPANALRMGQLLSLRSCQSKSSFSTSVPNTHS